jgi:hypothetical protein
LTPFLDLSRSAIEFVPSKRWPIRVQARRSFALNFDRALSGQRLEGTSFADKSVRVWTTPSYSNFWFLLFFATFELLLFEKIKFRYFFGKILFSFWHRAGKRTLNPLQKGDCHMAKIVVQNACILTGDVVEVNGDSMKLKTIEVRQNGSYDSFHTIRTDPAALKGIKVGHKVTLKGRLNRTNEKFSAHIAADPSTIAKVAKSAPYQNLAVVTGTVPFTAHEMPAAMGSGSFINLAIEFMGQIYNGVAFRTMATMYSRVWEKGAQAQLKGRLRERSFVDRNGDEMTSLEIIAEDARQTYIIRRATDNDPFGDYGKVQVGADPADDAQPEAQAAF